MPRIMTYTPDWLSRPSPGFAFFSPSNAPKSPVSKAKTQTSSSIPLRTTAVRGTEIFHVVGNELRWTDLFTLKQQHETQNDDQGDDEEDDERPPYRVLKVPGSLKITQLLVSPDGACLAIVTSHTVHVAVLPNHAHLSSKDTSPIKLRSFQLGPTTHVMECPPIAEVLWHPLGINGCCLVTVTEDAVVRVWELNREDRGSFETPNLAVDLKKLANAHSAAEDCSPSRYGTRKGFSPDDFEMQVAAACFGASADGGSIGWSDMTLWVAMKEGDVYVLCPLLPSIWQAQRSTVAGLAAQSRLDHAALAGMGDATPEALRAAQEQSSWISEIEGQLELENSNTASSALHTFHRPATPSPAPKLQGPFSLSPDPDQIFDIVDIQTLSATATTTSDTSNESSEEDEEQSEQAELVCLATDDGRVHICTSLSPIEPRWLPAKKGNSLLEQDSTEDLEMLIIESIALTKDHPLIFTPDVNSSSRIFVTHNDGVSHLDVSVLATKLDEELRSGADSGVDFRVEMLIDNGETFCETLIPFTDATATQPPVAAVNLVDSELGHLILTSQASQPHAVTLEVQPIDDALLDEPALMSPEAAAHLLEIPSARPPYSAPSAFWDPTALKTFLTDHVHSRTRQSLAAEVRLSPSTLTLLMEAHRLLSAETHRLGLAASDLFARAERLQDEFREQLRRARDATERVDGVLGLDDEGEAAPRGFGGDDGGDVGVAAAVDARIRRARSRQEELLARHDELRRKLARVGGRPIGEKERAWVGEVGRFEALVLGGDGDGVEDSAEDGRGESQEAGREDDRKDSASNTDLHRRVEAVRKLHSELNALVTSISERDAQSGSTTKDTSTPSDTEPSTSTSTSSEKTAAGERKPGQGSMHVALERRKARAAEIEALLERQSALVEGTREKLERLLGDVR